MISLKYTTTETIILQTNNGEMIIPKGAILYRLPHDHLGGNLPVYHYNWNGTFVEIDKDCEAIKKID